MKHYLNYEEFEEFIMQERPANTEFALHCEDVAGYPCQIDFKELRFHGSIILYTSDFFEGVGIIQDDARGWVGNISNLWGDITEMLELKPYFEKRE